jgi:hypothetical protein
VIINRLISRKCCKAMAAGIFGVDSISMYSVFDFLIFFDLNDSCQYSNDHHSLSAMAIAVYGHFKDFPSKNIKVLFDFA